MYTVILFVTKLAFSSTLPSFTNLASRSNICNRFYKAAARTLSNSYEFCSSHSNKRLSINWTEGKQQRMTVIAKMEIRIPSVFHSFHQLFTNIFESNSIGSFKKSK